MRRLLLAALFCVSCWSLAALHGGEATVRPASRPWLDMPPAPPTPTGALMPAIAFPHLSFQGAVAMTLAPRGNRFYVCEREGRVWSFENDPATTTKTLVLDLSGQCQGLDDCGLISLAFHPDFGLAGSPDRGRFFVYYEYTDQTPLMGDAPVYRPSKAGQYTQMSTHLWNRLSRFTIADGEVVVDPASETVLINQRDRHPWHGGGGMFFHPGDGFLWLVVGDEGSANDSPYDRTQRLNGGLFSGVLRLDVAGPRPGISHPIPRKPDLADPTTTTGTYGIPDDNPFVGLPGVLEEYWAVGLRSPHRMTHDPVSGMVLIGDIGQGLREEISLVVKGGNHQWAYREGNRDNNAIGPPYRINQPGGYAAGASVIAVDTGGATRGGTLLNERVVIAGVAGLYTVTAVAGFPHTQLTLAPALTGPVADDALITRTTGHALTTAAIAGDTVLAIDGAGMALGPRDCVVVQGVAGTYRVLTASATQLTIAPGLAAAAAAGMRIDLNPVIGREQAPLIDFDRSNFSAIIGGYIYRGTRHPDLVGSYIFGDNPTGRIWSIDPTQYPATAVAISHMNLAGPYDGGDSGYRGLSSFAVDAEGELYLLRMQYRALAGDPLPSMTASTGRIFSLVRNANTTTGPPLPATLSQTGAFATAGSGAPEWPLVPRADLIPYEVNSPLWSDGAHKRRWIALPNPAGKTTGFDAAGEQIAFAPTGEWSFPAGTVFVKHFELTVNEQTGARRRLETRLLVRSPAPAGGVYGVTYRWRPDHSEADLIDAAQNEAITVVGADGVSTRTETWSYPGRAECLSCHNDNAHWVLGVKTRQQNGPCSDPAFPTANQLRTWSTIGMFANPPAESELPALARTVPADDPSATLERRSRSWLDANCAHCHRPGGVQAFFDARYDTPLAEQGLIDGAVGIDLGVVAARVIAPRAVPRSILHLRDGSLTAGVKMPPLAKNRVDQAALATIGAWIDALRDPATITLAGLAQPYTGAPRVVTATTAPAGLTVALTYGGSSTPPQGAGTYAVSAQIVDAVYGGSASGTLTVAPATALVTLGALTQTYDGSARAAMATTDPAGLAVVVTYDGSATPPVAAGSYTVTATVFDPDHVGSANGTLVVAKAPATVALTGLAATYDGTAKPVTVSTDPLGLNVAVTYDGAPAAPSAVGSYAVVATVVDADHEGSANGTLVIQAADGGSPPPVYPSPGNGGCGVGGAVALMLGMLLVLARLRVRLR